MNFDELVNLYRNASEDNPIPDDFADQLLAAHTNDLSIRDAAVDTHVQSLAERDSVIKDLQAHNYQLLRKIPTDPPKQGSTTDADSDDDGEYTGTIDDLFKKKG